MSAESMRSIGSLLESMASLAAPPSGLADDEIYARHEWTERERSLYAAGIQTAAEAVAHWADLLHGAETTTQPHGTDRAPDTDRSES